MRMISQLVVLVALAATAVAFLGSPQRAPAGEDPITVALAIPLHRGQLPKDATEGVKFIKLTPAKGKAAHAPTAINVRRGVYPLARRLSLVTLGTPRDQVREFLGWIRSPPGQRIAAQAGYVPDSATPDRR